MNIGYRLEAKNTIHEIKLVTVTEQKVPFTREIRWFYIFMHIVRQCGGAERATPRCVSVVWGLF